MYAIIEDRGRQYKVQAGQELEIDLLSDQDAGAELTFDKVLLVSSEGDTKVGSPYVKGSKVKAKVTGQFKDKKVDVIRFKRRKGFKLKQGHRQHYTTIKIESID